MRSSVAESAVVSCVGNTARSAPGSIGAGDHHPARPPSHAPIQSAPATTYRTLRDPTPAISPAQPARLGLAPTRQPLHFTTATEKHLMLIDVQRAQPRKRRLIIRLPPTPHSIHRRNASTSAAHPAVGSTVRSAYGAHGSNGCTTPAPQVSATPAAPGQGNADLGRAPRRGHRGGGDHADHGVGPAQPLMQPLVSLLLVTKSIKGAHESNSVPAATRNNVAGLAYPPGRNVRG
jgi:hypothetical protein